MSAGRESTAGSGDTAARTLRSVKWTDYTEPARVRAIAAAIVSLVAALGLTLPFDLPAYVEVLLPLLGLIVPLIQGELTRRKVFSPATYHSAVGRHEAGLRQGPTA